MLAWSWWPGGLAATPVNQLTDSRQRPLVSADPLGTKANTVKNGDTVKLLCVQTYMHGQRARPPQLTPLLATVSPRLL